MEALQRIDKHGNPFTMLRTYHFHHSIVIEKDKVNLKLFKECHPSDRRQNFNFQTSAAPAEGISISVASFVTSNNGNTIIRIPYSVILDQQQIVFKECSP